MSSEPVTEPRSEQSSDFYDYGLPELSTLLSEQFAAPRYAAQQIFQWVYKRSVADFALMSNLGRELRRKLAERLHFSRARICDRQISRDGTRKYLFETERGNKVEAVMIKQPTRMTLCVSSQVGCGMGCKFCRTATMGFQKNLTVSEVVQQVLAVKEDAKNFSDDFSNIVFMGMGEPLHNFRGVVGALSILKDQHGLGIAPRRITVSSVGLVPAIERFGPLGIDVNIAISLNATTDEVRSKIMPINDRFPIARLIDCLKNYPLKPRRQFTIEYVLLRGINDSDDDLRRLPKLLRGIRAKINLIPYNENAGLGFFAPSRERIIHWQDALHRSGLDVTIRWSKGSDIDAACGQLATSKSAASKLMVDT